METIKNVLYMSVDRLTVFLIIVGLASSATLGVASLINAHPYVKYGLAALVVLFALDFLRGKFTTKKRK